MTGVTSVADRTPADIALAVSAGDFSVYAGSVLICPPLVLYFNEREIRLTTLCLSNLCLSPQTVIHFLLSQRSIMQVKTTAAVLLEKREKYGKRQAAMPQRL